MLASTSGVMPKVSRDVTRRALAAGGGGGGTVVGGAVVGAAVVVGATVVGAAVVDGAVVDGAVDGVVLEGASNVVATAAVVVGPAPPPPLLGRVVVGAVVDDVAPGSVVEDVVGSSPGATSGPWLSGVVLPSPSSTRGWSASKRLSPSGAFRSLSSAASSLLAPRGVHAVATTAVPASRSARRELRAFPDTRADSASAAGSWFAVVVVTVISGWALLCHRCMSPENLSRNPHSVPERGVGPPDLVAITQVL